MILLDESFAEAGASFVCVQEGRIPNDGLHSCRNFRMYRAGADTHGCYGVQVWVLHKLVRMVTAVNPISPRLLQVVIQIGPLFLHVISAHAPIEDAEEVCKEAFWSSLRLLISAIGPGESNLVLVGIDANARVGELQCDGIGSVAPAKENDNGTRLREFLCETGLAAVNTFYDAGTTWTSSYGTTARIDYVLSSSKLFDRTSYCSTCKEIDLATAIRDDHTSLLAGFDDVAGLFSEMASKIGRSEEFARARQQQARKYTAQSLRDPENRWHFQNAIATEWMRSNSRRRQRSIDVSASADVVVPAQCEIEGDLKLLVSAIRGAADDCFDAQVAAQHKPWLTQRTWEVVSFANQMRSMRRRMLRSQRTHLLGLAFRLWLSALTVFNESRHIILCGTVSVCNLYNAICTKSDLRIAMLERNLWIACRLRAQYVALDKVASIENAAIDAQNAANANDSKKLFTIVRRLAGVPARALTTLKDAAGNIVSSAADLAVLWRSHFCNVFKAGTVTELPEAYPNGSLCPSLVCEEPEVLYIDWSTFEQAQQARCFGFAPTLDDVEAVIGSLKGDSGVGADQLSAWLLKAGGRTVAVVVLELINDILAAKHVPMTWRGGRLVVLFKGKGSPSDPDNYRGILVSDHLGKILTALLQRHLNPLYTQLVGKSQFGAVAGRGTALASLSLRTFADLCSARGWSLFVLFIDLSKAFDYAIREVVMGWMPSMKCQNLQAKRDHLQKLGVRPEHSAELSAWIDDTGGLLLAAGADGSVVDLVASLHSGSWFQLPNDDKYIVSIAGGRQGCKLGALIFNAIYSVALARVRAELCKYDIMLHAKMRGSKPFWSADGVQLSFSKTCLADDSYDQVVEITYVDDEAIHIAASSPKVLMASIPVLMRHLCQVFMYFGFKINWKPGKTECFLTFRGKHSEAQRQKLVKQDGQLMIPLPQECGHPFLRVVRRYVHLGSGLDGACGPAPDVQIRTASALSAFTPISKKVFGNSWVTRAVRLRLLSSLVLSRLLYNVHTWSALTQAAYNRLNSVYMRGLRRIADCLRFSAESAHASGSDAYVRTLLGAPSLQCIIMQRRLLLLASILRNGSSRLVSLLAARGRDNQPLPWVRMISGDLQRTASYHANKFAELGDPLEHCNEWAAMITRFPGEWRELVKGVHYTSMELDVASRPKTNPGEWGSLPPAMHKCTSCGSSFPSAKALEAHRKAKHKTRAAAAKKVGMSRVCPCCHVQFSTRSRLLAHASEKRNRGSRAYTCSMLFATDLVKNLDDAELATAFEDDKQARTSARKSGHSVPISESLAKRPKVGTTILEQQRARKRKSAAGLEVVILPPNAVQLDDLHPLKRICTKMSQNQVILQHIAAQAADT